MLIYTGALIWVLLIYLYNNNGVIAFDEKQGATRGQAFMAMFYLVLFIGMRSAGADTAAYLRSYSQYPTGVTIALRTLFDLKKNESLFEAYGILMKTVFGNDYTPYLFGIAAITGFAVAKCLYKYSEGYFTSMVLFILWGTWSWMFNGIRQFLAVSITFLGLILIDEDEPIKYIIVVLIASRIHTSAIMMIPVFLLIRSEPWQGKTIITILVAVFAVVFSSQFLNALGILLNGTDYSSVLTNSYFLSDDGSNPIRTVLYALPTVLSFICREEIEQKAPYHIKICVNMSIICVCVSAIANVTSGIYIGRLPIYFSVYNMILLPWIFCNTSIKEQQGWIPGVMGLYLTEYIYEYYFSSHIYYASDKLHLYLR